jgi:hypothetical protein
MTNAKRSANEFCSSVSISMGCGIRYHLAALVGPQYPFWWLTASANSIERTRPVGEGHHGYRIRGRGRQSSRSRGKGAAGVEDDGGGSPA